MENNLKKLEEEFLNNGFVRLNLQKKYINKYVSLKKKNSEKI